MSERVVKKQAKSRPPAQKAPAPSEAQQRAALILEVLAGQRRPQEAAGALKVSTNHYYLLERRALAGLVAACQPQPKGKRPSHEKELMTLRQALARCEQECQRQAALVRATQRAVGVPVTPAVSEKRSRAGKPVKSSGRRRRAPAVRALRAARQLSEQATLQESAERATGQSNSLSHEGATP